MRSIDDKYDKYDIIIVISIWFLCYVQYALMLVYV